jgi:hypothetical protein
MKLLYTASVYMACIAPNITCAQSEGRSSTNQPQYLYKNIKYSLVTVHTAPKDHKKWARRLPKQKMEGTPKGAR